MTEKLRNSARHYELAGAITCAGFLACAQWFLNRDMLVTPMFPGVLIKYLTLNLICYLLALLLIRRRWLVIEVPITGFVATAVLGAVLSAIIVDVPFMLSYWGGREFTTAHMSEMSWRFSYFVVLNCFLTVPIMAVLYWLSSAGNRYGSSQPSGGI